MTPKFTTIKGWGEISGMSRTGTYNALKNGFLRAVKQGEKTLVDVDHGLDWIASLPAASFGPGSNEVAA